MSDEGFRSLGEVVADPLFPTIDLALRAGGHVDDLDLDRFVFLEDARPYLERFYAGYGCDLVRSVDRYYYLHPRGDQLGRHTLSAAEMLVGQALCLLRMDPATLEAAGRVPRVRVLELLDQLVGGDRLGQALNPRARSRAVSEERIRQDVDGAVGGLARLGFVDVEGEQVRLRAPLLRFLEPLLDQPAPKAALETLVGTGAVEAPDDDADDADAADRDDEDP